jgi:hypothetical protein
MRRPGTRKWKGRVAVAGSDRVAGSTAAGQGALSTRIGRSGPAALRERWRVASLRTGWSHPDDWGCPEVDAVTELVTAGPKAVRPALARLANARALAGVWLDETIEDVIALESVLPPEVLWPRPEQVVRLVAQAWADEGAAQFRHVSVEDPLTGLVSLPYLRTRLVEVYREAGRAGERVPDTHALVVVSTGVGVRPGLGGTAAGLYYRLALGECLRSVFSGGESLAAASAARVLGLVHRGPALPVMVRTARLELASLSVADAKPRCWIEGLPDGIPAALDLVTELSR